MATMCWDLNLKVRRGGGLSLVKILVFCNIVPAVSYFGGGKQYGVIPQNLVCLYYYNNGLGAVCLWLPEESP